MEKTFKIAVLILWLVAGFAWGMAYEKSKPHKLNEPICFERAEQGELCITLGEKK